MKCIYLWQQPHGSFEDLRVWLFVSGFFLGCFLLIATILLHLHPNLVFWYYCLGHVGLRWCCLHASWGNLGLAILKRSQILPKTSLHLSVKLSHFSSSSPVMTCEIQPSLTMWSVAFGSASHLQQWHAAVSHITSRSFPYPAQAVSPQTSVWPVIQRPNEEHYS